MREDELLKFGVAFYTSREVAARYVLTLFKSVKGRLLWWPRQSHSTVAWSNLTKAWSSNL